MAEDCTHLLTLQTAECADEPFFPTCEDEGETCENPDPDRCSLCGQMTEYLKRVVRAPTDRCSFMRYLMDPVTGTEFYQTYARCKVEVPGYAIAISGALLTLVSLFQFPWLEDVTCCFDKDNKDCSSLWLVLSTYLFLKDSLLNIMGIFTNMALILAIKYRNLDCIYLWLVWRTAAVALGAITLALIGIYSLTITQNLNWTVFTEVTGFLANLIALVVVYAIFEKYAGCLEGGSGEEYEGEDDGYLRGVSNKSRRSGRRFPEAISGNN